MRKLDFLIVVGVIALGAAGWQLRTVSCPLSPTSSCTASAAFPAGSRETGSGRWSVLANRYSYAGLTIGMSQSEVLTVLGEPARKQQENQESSTWSYTKDGAELNLAWLEDRLIMAGGTGRWPLIDGGRGNDCDPGRPEATIVPAPTVGSSRMEVINYLGFDGQPQRKDGTSLVYSVRPGELTFHFEQDFVSQVVVTGEIAPRRLSP